MAREFKSANLHEIQDIISAFPFSRRITEVHLHHTWRPRQEDYRGLATIEGMWRHHTQTNGWSDIGQHITVAPDGAIWLCRNFNWAPASARGFNGNRSAGPFMIEMIGDFDEGKETISREQRDATLAVIKSVQQRFHLDASALRFHNEMSAKSCPGTSQNKADWISLITQFQLGVHRPSSREMPFPSRYNRAYELMRGMNPDAEQTDDMANCEHDGQTPFADAWTDQPSFTVTDLTHETALAHGRALVNDITTDMLETLTNHVVNIERGRFSNDGKLETTLQDVDRIFEQRLPAEIETARADGRKAQILFYAHGGLVSEKNALLGARKQLSFWRDNGIYPVFFIWETGVAETIRQLVSEAASRTQPSSSRGVTDWLTDKITDPIIEQLTRAAGGRLLWSGMKSSAELASQPGNAAHHVARKMAQIVNDPAREVDVHIVGHSAGCIFHTHLIPQLLEAGVSIATAHFLAPAVRNDLFHQQLAPFMGNGLGPLTVFTMNKQREKADDVASLYHKSLLYLVSRAFEDDAEADIIGLEESLRRDPKARSLFGLDGTTSRHAEVVWSPSPKSLSGNHSTATTHGAFDDDPATMESVVRRVLDLRNGEAIVPFPANDSRGVSDIWKDQFNWPDRVAYLSRLEQAMQTSSASSSTAMIAATGDTGTTSNTELPANVVPADSVYGGTEQSNLANDSSQTTHPTITFKEGGYSASTSLKTIGEKLNTSYVKDEIGGNNKNTSNDANKGKWSYHSATSSKTIPSVTAASFLENHHALAESLEGDKPEYRALCIGIDAYRRSPLNGCVADAVLWKQTLSSLGYKVKLLVNADATAKNIRRSVRKLIKSSSPGDNLVLQFAGHGTQFTDHDGDEANGDSPALDECLCAVDCDLSSDGLVIDDELRTIIGALPEGVSMTCFFDCCHSGSATRSALNMAGHQHSPNVKARYLYPNERMKNTYYKRIQKLKRKATRSPSLQRDVLFSACRSTELAYESDGQGDFTRRATAIIRAGVDGISNVEFLERLLSAFGNTPKQHPEIHCDLSARHSPFLNRSQDIGPSHSYLEGHEHSQPA